MVQTRFQAEQMLFHSHQPEGTPPPHLFLRNQAPHQSQQKRQRSHGQHQEVVTARSHSEQVRDHMELKNQVTAHK